MAYWFLVTFPPLVVALAYGRAPFFAWYGVGLAWLAALGWLAGWPPALAAGALVALAGVGAVFLLPALRRQRAQWLQQAQRRRQGSHWRPRTAGCSWKPLRLRRACSTPSAGAAGRRRAPGQ